LSLVGDADSQRSAKRRKRAGFAWGRKEKGRSGLFVGFSDWVEVEDEYEDEDKDKDAR
jgi:hypothetical protein